MKRSISALFCGALFGLGLAVSQMSEPAKVLGFLDIAGDWDPSLLLVLGAAVTITVIAFRIVLRLPHPLFDRSFEGAPPEKITSRLIIGAMLFGIGWGLGGFCPGPGVVALTSRLPMAVVFLIAFMAGSQIFRLMNGSNTQRVESSSIGPTEMSRSPKRPPVTPVIDAPHYELMP